MNHHYTLSINFVNVVKGIFLAVFILVAIFSLTAILTSLKPEYRLSSDSIYHATYHMSGRTLYKAFALEHKIFMNDEEGEAPSFSETFFTLATNIRIKDPRSLLGRELPGFAIFDSKILVADEGTNYTNMPIESYPPEEVFQEGNEAELQNIDNLDKDNNASDPDGEAPSLTTGEEKVVHIYFTHNRESFLPYLKGVDDPNGAMHSEINVTKIGDHLKKHLEDRGIGTNVDKTDIYGNLMKKNLSYRSSYNESRALVKEVMAQNKSLQYFIDIHRDSQRKDVTTINMNNESYAKVAFVIGGEHANYEKNAKLAKELHAALNKKYKGISRGVIMQKGAGTNGKFNQDLSQNGLLLEFGGVDNTFEELERTAKVFAEIFSEYYWQAEKVNHPSAKPANKK